MRTYKVWYQIVKSYSVSLFLSQDKKSFSDCSLPPGLHYQAIEITAVFLETTLKADNQSVKPSLHVWCLKEIVTFMKQIFKKNAALGGEMSNFHLPEGVEGGDDEEFCMWWEEPGESFACRDTSKNVYFQFLTGKIYYSVISTLQIWCFPNVVRKTSLTQNSTKILERNKVPWLYSNMKEYILDVYPEGLRW